MAKRTKKVARTANKEKKTPIGAAASRATNPREGWTVMVFMAAAKDARTEQAAIRDMQELERIGSTDKVHVVAQIDRRWPGRPERYEIGQGRSKAVPIEETSGTRGTTAKKIKDDELSSTGVPAALTDFLLWAEDQHKAERYMLVLWGHAYGLGFGREHGDPLTLRELASALAAFAEKRQGEKLELLGANACAMSYAEAAFELRDAAQYMVASEITMPFAGWPYSQILGRLADDSDQSAPVLGDGIIDDFLASFEHRGVSLTLLNLGRVGPLREQVSTLGAELRAGMQNSAVCQSIGDAFLDTVHGDVRPLIDLVDLCKHLQRVPDPRLHVTDAVRQLQDFLKPGDRASIAKIKTGKDAEQAPLILRHGCDPDFVGLNGLGIFAQAVADPTDLARLELSQKEYLGLGFVAAEEDAKLRENPWGKFVYDDLKVQLEPLREAVEEYITGSGASSREERMAMGQLLIGVGRAFRKLDKSLTAAQTSVGDLLGKAQTARQSSRARTAAPGLFLRLLDALERSAAEEAPTPEVPPTSAPTTARTAAIAAAPSQTFGTAGVGHDPALLIPLRDLEDSLATAEKTMSRVLTHGTLGLGGGGVVGGLGIDLGTQGPKPGLGGIDPGTGQPKPGLGADLGTPGPKPGLGIDLGTQGPKAGLGIDLGTQRPKPGMGQTIPTLAVTVDESGGSPAALFRAVAVSLGRLETAMAALQQLVLEESKSKRPLSMLALDRVNHSFGTMRTLVASARATALLVLLHPTEGLGPTRSTGFGVITRQHLAAAAGLSPQQLRLM